MHISTAATKSKNRTKTTIRSNFKEKNMKAKSILGLSVLVLLLLGFSTEKTTAQEPEKQRGKIIKLPGAVKGTIYIQNVSGNNLQNFGCKNLAAIIYPLSAPPKWRRSRIGTGD